MIEDQDVRAIHAAARSLLRRLHEMSNRAAANGVRAAGDAAEAGQLRQQNMELLKEFTDLRERANQLRERNTALEDEITRLHALLDVAVEQTKEVEDVSHALGVRLGMDGHGVSSFTVDEIYAHVQWLEQVARGHGHDHGVAMAAKAAGAGADAGVDEGAVVYLEEALTSTQKALDEARKRCDDLEDKNRALHANRALLVWERDSWCEVASVLADAWPDCVPDQDGGKHRPWCRHAPCSLLDEDA